MTNAPWMDVVKRYDGIKEIPGRNHNNNDILRFYALSGSPQKADEVPWCSAFINAAFFESGPEFKQFMTYSLLAQSWLKAPNCDVVSVEDAEYGDIVVLHFSGQKSWQGHVGFFVRRTGRYVLIHGGNQRNSVNIQRFNVSSVIGVRRPRYVHKAEMPSLVKTKKPPIVTKEEAVIGGLGGVTALSTQNLITAAIVIAIVIGIVGYFWWKRRKNAVHGT